MNKYGQTALIAEKYVKEGLLPREAWEKASCEVFEKGRPSQKKGCPRNTFIGIFDNEYKSNNADYARNAVEYLKTNNIKEIDERKLWSIVHKGNIVSYNSQMHVVMALYRNGLL